MELLFKIGEVADMFETSIRALRLYDKMGLFKPGFTDEQTGYRYYTADQIPFLNTILVFKAIGLRLVEIKQLVDKGIQPDELLAVLKKKKSYWEDQIEKAKFNIENIERIVSAVELVQEEAEKGKKDKPDAYKMARLVCLENLKIETILSEALWV